MSMGLRAWLADQHINNHGLLRIIGLPRRAAERAQGVEGRACNTRQRVDWEKVRSVKVGTGGGVRRVVVPS